MGSTRFTSSNNTFSFFSGWSSNFFCATDSAYFTELLLFTNLSWPRRYTMDINSTVKERWGQKKTIKWYNFLGHFGTKRYIVG